MKTWGGGPVFRVAVMMRHRKRMRDGRRCSGVNTECRFHMRIRRGVSCTLCPPVPWLPVVTTPVLPPPPAVLWRLEVRGREVYCDAARYAHICIPVEPDSGTYVFMMTTLWPPYGASCFAHYSNTA